MARAGTISSIGNSGATMWSTGVLIGPSFGCAGNSGRIHTIAQARSM